MKEKRLSKALAAAGIASRRKCEELIFSGRVQVNGKKVQKPQTMVNWESDEIRINDNVVSKEEKKLYYLLNKPTGYICSSLRVGSKKLVVDLFAHLPSRLFTVGRLDRDTSGLLLVTNDGHFCQKVIHPSANIIKEYLVKVAAEVTEDHLETIRKGIRIDNTWVRPKKVIKVRNGTIKIAVKEGKKHEVRLLIKKAQLPLRELKRIRLGSLTLGTLPIGAFRTLSKKEISDLIS